MEWILYKNSLNIFRDYNDKLQNCVYIRTLYINNCIQNCNENPRPPLIRCRFESFSDIIVYLLDTNKSIFNRVFITAIKFNNWFKNHISGKITHYIV